VLARKKLQSEGLSSFWLWSNAVWTTSRGDPLEFDNRKYLVDIYKDQHPEIVIMKAAQMGVSERLIAEAVWICEQMGKKVLFTFPAETQLNDFVQDRLEPVLFSSKYLKKRIEDADKYGFKPESIPFIDKRMLASNLGWRREVSTPTFPGDPERKSNIHGSYLASDQRVWKLKCEACGEWQELDFFKNVQFKTGKVVCRECGKPMDRLKEGEWVARFPERDVHGYKINGIYNPMREVSVLLKEYYLAQEQGYSAIQQFYNQVIGIPYEVEGAGLTDSDLDACIRDYSIPVDPKEVGPCFAGVDVGDVNNVVIGTPKGDKTRYVWIGTVKEFFDSPNSLESLIKKYDIRTMVIDLRPERRMVRKLIEMFPGRVFAGDYPTTKKFPVNESDQWDEFKKQVLLDRTPNIDYLVNNIKSQDIELPANIGTVNEFYRQMTASKRIVEKNPRTGIESAKWVERGPDHYLHAAVYERAARLKGSGSSALLDYYQSDDDSDEDTQANELWRWIRLRGQRIF